MSGYQDRAEDSIEMDMNNRKADTRTEMKGFDMSIEVCPRAGTG